MSRTRFSFRPSTVSGRSLGEAVISFEMVRTASNPLSRAQSRYLETCSTFRQAAPVFTSTRHCHLVLPRSTTIAPSGMHRLPAASVSCSSV
ncbi:MAG: hypothetical protein QOI91_2347 [Solirubrobacteraceae bacterium]|nr:hypothetical protein [Solirubrobacteraceae bacterium]